MISGIMEINGQKIAKESIYRMFQRGQCDRDTSIFTDGPLSLGMCVSKVPTLETKLVFNKGKTLVIAFEGNIFNSQSVKDDAEFFLRSYERLGEDCVDQLNGSFAFAVWDKRKEKLILGRDRLGIESLYYFWDGKRLVFASSVKSILGVIPSKEINFDALHRYLLFNYNPGQDTLFKNINKIRPGHLLILENKNLFTKRYWYLSFSNLAEKNEDEYCEELLNLLRDSVKIRVDSAQQSGAFISGGMDSSTVVGLMSSVSDQTIRTFSFRCLGKSYDESNYARIVSQYYKTDHHEVTFNPEDVASIEEIVENMDEPFCDIGIEVASYILGRLAEGKVNYVLTGDGGDELFAGHPVYIADRVANFFEKMPQFLKNSIIEGFQFLPDTDKKKNFLVKAKRFSYSYNFPRELLSNRWRIYYNSNELREICTEELLNIFEETNNPYKCVLEYNQEADGRDYLSRSLYGDYNTVVGFYLRRIALIRAFGIEGRFPMLDHRLIEFAATIPSKLKIKGFSDSKYILKKTMTGILPDEIVFRKDKLGHSVPMKNWMRDLEVVKKMMRDVLSEEAIKRRGYFNFQAVEQMIKQHLSKTHNHSHRLWALMVLELWLRKNFD